MGTILNMTISSPAFEPNQPIPDKYTCKGENVSPPLLLSDVPVEAQSLVLIVDDPDAPSKTWVHWVVYNIDPKTTEVKENMVPNKGKQALTDFDKPAYGGPCPPSGTHRYFFKLYALDERLSNLPDFTDKAMLEEVMQGHILVEAELIGLFSA